MTLSEALTTFGYHAEPSTFGSKRILCADGSHATTGTIAHVWHWLRAQGHDVGPCATRERGDFCSHCAVAGQPFRKAIDRGVTP